MASQIVTGNVYLQIEAEYADVVAVQMDEESVRIKINNGEAEQSAFLSPADAVAMARFILSQVDH